MVQTDRCARRRLPKLGGLGKPTNRLYECPFCTNFFHGTESSSKSVALERRPEMAKHALNKKDAPNCQTKSENKRLKTVVIRTSFKCLFRFVEFLLMILEIIKHFSDLFNG